MPIRHRRRMRGGRLLLVSVFGLASLAAGGPAGAARPGDPDRSFGGGDGRVFLAGEAATRILSMAVDGEGRITVAASMGRPLHLGQPLIARRLPDGSPDPTYADGGQRVLDPTPGEDELFGADVTPSGGMVLFARSGRTGTFSLTRVGPDGRLDRTFGEGGTMVDRFGKRIYWGSVIVQADGRIIVAGLTLGGTGTPLRRYQRDGTIDPTFGIDGQLQVRNVDVGDLVQRPDGRFLAIGTDAGIPYGPFVAARQYSPKGRLDRSFGDDGLALLAVDPAIPSVLGVGQAIVDRSGRIIVPGELLDPQRDRSDAIVAVMNRDGTTRRAFSGDGWALLDVSRSDGLFAVAPAPEGRFLGVGGTADALNGDWRSTPGSLLVVLYLPDGRLDPAFGDGGVTTMPIRRAGKPAYTFGYVAIAHGTTLTVAGNGADDGLIARFLVTPS